jgi:SAM-dependent methyltransferase
MSYLMAGQLSELGRLQLQSKVWEPAGEALLAELGDGRGKRALDVGCGAYGWLPILGSWVGPQGQVVGTDIDATLLGAARAIAPPNVELIEDDIFQSTLEPRSFDLVHVRFELAPIGRFEEQMAIHTHHVRPGGVLVLEEPDSSSWRVNPEGPAAERLVELIRQAFRASGGDFDVGRRLPELLRGAGAEEVEVAARLVALPVGHPYLRNHIQFSVSLEPRLLKLVGAAELAAIRAAAEAELEGRWGLPFTLIQAWGRIP